MLATTQFSTTAPKPVSSFQSLTDFKASHNVHAYQVCAVNGLASTALCCSLLGLPEHFCPTARYTGRERHCNERCTLIARICICTPRQHMQKRLKMAIAIKEGIFGLFPHKHGGEERWVVTKVTVDKNITDFTYGECLEMWKLFLIKALEIPEGRIEFCRARTGNTTTLVFKLAQTHTLDTNKKLYSSLLLCG